MNEMINEMQKGRGLKEVCFLVTMVEKICNDFFFHLTVKVIKVFFIMNEKIRQNFQQEDGTLGLPERNFF